MSTKRDQLINAAMKLFCEEGFQATGVDRILKEAGVAKMTLYNHFKSKDELVLAALRRRDEIFRNEFMRKVKARAETPAGRLEALFDVLHEWFTSKDFRGCVFVNAAAEYPNSGCPIRTVVAEHIRLMRDYMRDLAAEAGADDPEAMADTLSLLTEGAINMAQAGLNKEAAHKARVAAQPLLDKLPQPA
jgi:AcrR family transcriptional regulator